MALKATVGTNMSVVRMRFDFTQIIGLPARMRTKFADRKVPLEICARTYMSEKIIKKRFQAQGNPRWKRLSPKTIANRKSLGFSKGPILRRSGLLRNSATGGAGWEANYYPSGKSTQVQFGSSLDYAAVHDRPRGDVNEGNIPGRPWSQLTQKNVNEMRDIFVGWAVIKMRELAL